MDQSLVKCQVRSKSKAHLHRSEAEKALIAPFSHAQVLQSAVINTSKIPKPTFHRELARIYNNIRKKGPVKRSTVQ